MRSGRLRERLLIERPQMTKLANGEKARLWVFHAFAWANVRALTERSHTREELEAGQVNSYVSYDFEMRGRKDLTTEMRIFFEGKVFDINAIIDVELLGRELLVQCVERQDNGNDY